MKKLTLEMPIVKECAASQCAYNLNKKCHAKAITVGDAQEPACDTYLPTATRHSRDVTRVAGVGACKVAECLYNDDYECQAEAVQVGFEDGAIHCLTYRART